MGFRAAESTAVYLVKKTAGSGYRRRGAAELAKVDPLFSTGHEVAALTVDLVVLMRICGGVSVDIIIFEHVVLLSGHYMLAFVKGGRYCIYKPQAKGLKPLTKAAPGR